VFLDLLKHQLKERDKREEKMKPTKWIIFLLLNILFLIVIYIVLKELFPEPTYLIGGKYINTADSLMVIFLVVYGFVMYFFLKTKFTREGKL